MLDIQLQSPPGANASCSPSHPASSIQYSGPRPVNVLAELRHRFRDALLALELEQAEADGLVQLVLPIQDAKFGDYQANCAMPLGKRLGKPPRKVATRLVEKLQVADMCDPPEIAGPGFINLRLKNDWIVSQLAAAS